jgi:hypothetical protein
MHIDKELLKNILRNQLNEKKPKGEEKLTFSQPSLFASSEPDHALYIDERYWKLLTYVIDHDPTSDYVFYGNKFDYI